MSLIRIVALCAVVVMASASPNDPPRLYVLSEAPQHFATFMKDYDRSYKDDADKEVHYRAFVENLKKINDLNKKNPSATYGINKFADYTPEESANMRGLRRPEKESSK